MIMRRLTTLLQTALPKPYTLPSYHHLHSFNTFRSYFAFTTAPLSLLQKFQALTDDKQLGDLMSKLSSQKVVNKQVYIRILLKKVYDKVLPQRVIVDQNVLAYLQKMPVVHFQAFYYRMSQQMQVLQQFKNDKNEQGIKLVIRNINECFVDCFQILKSIPKQILPKIQVKLHRAFAAYHVQYLFNIVPNNKKKEVMTKGRQFYKSSLNRTTSALKLMIEERRKLKERMIEVDETQERRQMQLKLIRQEIFDLMEQTSATTFLLLKLQHFMNTQLQQPVKAKTKSNSSQRHQSKQSNFQFQEGVLNLQSFFRRATDHYQLLQNAKLQSKFYLKVKKMLIELCHHQKLLQIENKKLGKVVEKEMSNKLKIKFNQEIQQLYKQAMNHYTVLWQSKNNFNQCEETAAVLLSLKLYSLDNLSNDQNQYENAVMKQVKHLAGLATSRIFRNAIASRLKDIARSELSIDSQQNQQSDKNVSNGQRGSSGRRLRHKR